MKEKLDGIHKESLAEIQRADSVNVLDQLRVKYLGKKGELTTLLKQIGKLPPEERRQTGQLINEVKQKVSSAIDLKNSELVELELQARIEQEKIDVTLPGRKARVGSIHPVNLVAQSLKKIFAGMGFVVETGPEIEDDYHNFEALNIPKFHPARSMQDTLYLDSGHVLRTHTSNVQIRTMEKQKPPLKIIAPGKVYRHDMDATHTPMFNQLEGLWVDESVTFSDLRGVLQDFLEKFFETQIELRFRASFFPFTEPSAEVDIKLGKNSDWLEVLGCGMIDPNVLESVGIDSDKYQGFAFGIGMDRLAMLKYGINDLRIMFENDVALLEQFRQG